MAVPKKKLSKSKSRIRRKIWKNKSLKNVLNALNRANILLKELKD